MYKIFLLFLLLAGGVFFPLEGQIPKTDFASQGALMDNFFLRLQAKISYSFSESSRHFGLIWESTAKKGEKAIREKAAELGAAGQEKVKEVWKETSANLEGSFEKGKKAVSSGVKSTVKQGKEFISTAAEEKKYP